MTNPKENLPYRRCRLRRSRRLARGFVSALVVSALTAFASGPSAETLTAQAVTTLRIGTGGAGGTYYPIGRALAEIWTQRLNSCDPVCAAAPFLAVAQFSNGSVSNVENLENGTLEAGLVQADIAYWAMTGSGIFADGQPQRELRSIATLFSETLQIVVEADLGVQRFEDLAGLRISLDERGSGTLIAVRTLLEVHGMDETDLQAEYMKPVDAVERMRAGTLDGFVIMAGQPTESVLQLANERALTLVPIDRTMAEEVARKHPYFSPGMVGDGIYSGIAPTPTVSVGAQLLVDRNLDDDLVYELTRVLWTPETLERLAARHDKGKEISLSRALRGLAVPLHPGAERFYSEAGVLH